MEKTRKIGRILVLAVALCFLLVSLAQAGNNDPVTQGWAKRNLLNKKKTTSIPIWQITEDGTAKSVRWVDHAPNPRFAICDFNGDNSGGEDYYVDDLVLDKETGLVWLRDANIVGGEINWHDAINYCRDLMFAERKGWRLATIEELSTIVDARHPYPSLPTGHPFIKVEFGTFWSSSISESNSGYAWIVRLNNGSVDCELKTEPNFVWPVRGGNGYVTGNW